MRTYICAGMMVLAMVPTLWARVKLVALPERDTIQIRINNEQPTLIEEERTLSLQQGINHIDFSWKGVQIDGDSIRLKAVSDVSNMTLLNVSYPPGEHALVWEVFAKEAGNVRVRISYLLDLIDRLMTYRWTANKAETALDFKSYVILRNFSGEDFHGASLVMDGTIDAGAQSIAHEETRQLLLANKPAVPVKKVWVFDSAQLPWDPEQVDGNVGIPVYYEVENTEAASLGETMLDTGRVRVYQSDGHGGTIFLGEDDGKDTPVGEKMRVYIGDSRDIVVTQRRMHSRKFNVRRNKHNRVVLYDSDEEISVKIQNFKDQPATLVLKEYIYGEWDMKKCTMPYERKSAEHLEFTIMLKPEETRELTMRYNRRNIR